MSVVPMRSSAPSTAPSPGIERVVDPVYWGDHGAPHDVLQRLRREQPVARYDGGAVDPFWLVTRHDDIEAISKNPTLWSSVPRTVLDAPRGGPRRLHSIVHMDPPDHTRYRAVMQSWLTPRRLRLLEGRMREVATDLIDRIAQSEACDFVAEVAAVHPLRMLCEMLGITPADEPEVLRITRLLFAKHDVDYAQPVAGQAPQVPMLAFCKRLVEARRAAPADDLAGTIANARIDDAPIGEFEAMSNLAVFLSAGHDTTSSAMSGGLAALIRHPEALRRLQAEPALLPSAIEEMLRYVTPTTNFVRTATADTVLRGQPIGAGDDVCLHYAAANRDELLFDDPDAFRIDRRPNRHLGFGIGTHGCIGQMLARMEMKTLFEVLIPRIRDIELASEPVHIRAYWVSGLKRMPIRYRLH